MLNNTTGLSDSVVTTLASPKINSPEESPTPVSRRPSRSPPPQNSIACGGGGGGGGGSSSRSSSSTTAAIGVPITGGHSLLDTSYCHFTPSLRYNNTQPSLQGKLIDWPSATPLCDMELRDWMQRTVAQRSSGPKQLFSTAEDSHPLLALAPFSTHSANLHTTKAHSTHAHSTKASPTVSTPTTDARAPSPRLHDLMLEDCFETKLGRDLLRAALILDSQQQQQQQPQSHATSATLLGDGLPVPVLSTDPSPLFHAITTPGLLSPPRHHHHSRHHHHHLMSTSNKHFTGYTPDDRNSNNTNTTGPPLSSEGARNEVPHQQNFRQRGSSPTQRSRSTSEFLGQNDLPRPSLDHHLDVQGSSASLLARSSPLISRGLHLSSLDDGASSIGNNNQPASSPTVAEKCFAHLENGYISANTENPTHVLKKSTTEINSSYVSQSHKASERCSPRALKGGEQMLCSEESYHHYQNPPAITTRYTGPTFCSASSPFSGPNRPLAAPLESSSPTTRHVSEGVTLAGNVGFSGAHYESHIAPVERTTYQQPAKFSDRGPALQKWSTNPESDATGPFLDFHNLSSILSGEAQASGGHTIQHCFRAVDSHGCFNQPYHPAHAYGVYTSGADGEGGVFASWLSPPQPRSATTTENSGDFQTNDNSISLLNPNGGPIVQFGGSISHKGSRRFLDLESTNGTWRGPPDVCPSPEKHEAASTSGDTHCNNSHTTNTLPVPDGPPLPPPSSLTTSATSVGYPGGKSPKEMDLINTMTATTATPLRYGNESQAAESVQQLVSSASSSSGSSLTEKAGLPSVSFAHLYTPTKSADSCLITPSTALQPPVSFTATEKDSALWRCDKPSVSSSSSLRCQNCHSGLDVEPLGTDLVARSAIKTALCRPSSLSVIAREKNSHGDVPHNEGLVVKASLNGLVKEHKASSSSTCSVEDLHVETALSSSHPRLSITDTSKTGPVPPTPPDTAETKEAPEESSQSVTLAPPMSQTKKLNGARQRIAPLPKEQLVELLAWACVEHSDVAARTEEVVISSPSCRRLMVRNISFLASDSEFRNFMQQFGPIEDCAVVREPDKASRGFGFVTFRDLKDVERLLALPSAQLVFRCRQLFLKLASDPFAEFPDAAAAIPGGPSFTVGSRFSETASTSAFLNARHLQQPNSTTAGSTTNATGSAEAQTEAGDCIHGIEGRNLVNCDGTARGTAAGSTLGSSTSQSCTSTNPAPSTLYTPPSEPFCRREVFLRNLPFNTTEADIRLLLKEDGVLAHCRVVNNEKSGTAFGFAVFESWEGAMKAVQQPQRNLDNRSVFLSFASKRTGAKRHYTYHNARQRVLRQQQQQRDVMGPQRGIGGSGNGGRSASVFHPGVSYPTQYPC